MSRLKKQITYLISILLIFLSVKANSQVTFQNNPNTYFEENMDVREFDKSRWKELSKDLNYSNKKEPEKEEKEDNQGDQRKEANKSLSNFNFALGTIGKLLLYGLAIAILIFVIAKLTGANIFAQNKKITDQDSIDIETLEEELHESDLDRALKAALATQQYKLAIRIYYLIILKELSLKNFINWKKEKTNREYIYEMDGREDYLPFVEVTRIFERAWYREEEVGEGTFKTVSPAFKSFVEKLRKSEA